MVATGLSELVERVAARQKDKREPYLLLLGRDCARASGQPLEKVAQQILKLGAKTTPLAPFLPVEGSSVVDIVSALVTHLGPQQGTRLLRTMYAQLPVPLFYQDLAGLIKLGYFTQILTTNYDDLLEQALNGAGMSPLRDYCVVNVADDNQAPESAATSVSILKLHGDLASSRALLRPDEIEKAFWAARRMLRSELRGDLILVGYDGESPPLEVFLQKAGLGEWWWVAETNDPPNAIRQAAGSAEFHTIQGEEADVTRFFATLYQGLRRAPALESMKMAAPRSEAAPPSVTPMPGSPREDRADLLRGQIRRARSALYQLQQSLVPGEEDPALVAQIEYQSVQVACLEEELRALPENRERVLKALDALWEAVESNPRAPQGTSQYVGVQRDAVRSEYARPSPNHILVSAAIGAASLVARRLGPEVVSGETIGELAGLAPGGIGR